MYPVRMSAAFGTKLNITTRKTDAAYRAAPQEETWHCSIKSARSPATAITDG
jgi:hypothetical protein